MCKGWSSPLGVILKLRMHAQPKDLLSIESATLFPIQPMTLTVRLTSVVLAYVQEEALRLPNMECCGLLAGLDSIITQTFPATNALASATAYEISPQELFGIMRKIRAAGLQMMGIYHSHPHGENTPSPRDIERAYYPEAAYFILTAEPSAPQPVRAFSIRDGRFTELKIQPI